MSSGSRITSAIVLCAALIAAGCNRAAATPDVIEAPPLVQVPVGTLPGPSLDELEGPANPFETGHESLSEGRRFFVSYNCAGCHGDHGGGGMGPSLRDHVWIYGSSHGHIANSIAQGRAYGMPSWRKMLTDAQIWQITAYVKSMRTNREPQAPTP
jgi:cytochrome c oxidase cbb3-type subunit III